MEKQERDQQLWILTTSCRANHEGVSFLPRKGHKNRNGPIGKESVGKGIALGERVSSHYNSIGTGDMLILVSCMSRTSYLYGVVLQSAGGCIVA